MILNVSYKKVNGQLVWINSRDKELFDKHVAELREGQKITAVYDLNSDSGRLSQIAKLKAGIREISREVGETFEDMQNRIKKGAGYPKNSEGEYKSFADASKEELSDAIQSMIELGDFMGINVR